MKKFSIIVPVYNVEMYIEECIKSILNQQYDDYELILINDGSKDLSKKICLEYKDNEKIIFIDSDNKGVSNARNIGLEKASGEYILFIDADDVLMPSALKTINKELNDEIDLLVFSYKRIYSNCEVESKLKCENLQKEDAINYLLKEDYYCGYVWNKVFKKRIIDDYNLNFDTTIYMNEDLLFCYNYLQRITQNIKTISNVLYKYRIRKVSATNSSLSYKNISSIYVYKFIYDTCETKEAKEIMKIYYLRSYFKYNKYKNEFDEDLIKNILENDYAFFPLKEKIKIFIYKYVPKIKNLVIKLKNLLKKPYK